MCPASPHSPARSSCSMSSDRSGWGARASLPDLALSSGPSQVPDSLPAAPSPLLPAAVSPQILLRGECSQAAAASTTPAVHATDPHFGAPRLKSIVVRPSPESKLSDSGDADGWTAVKSRKERRASKNPPGRHAPSAPRRSGRRSSINGLSGRDAFLRRFKGLCFRCLSSLHRRVDCRDPLHCIICKLPGHYGRECPQNPRNLRGGGSVKERLGLATRSSSPRRPWSTRSSCCESTPCCSPRLGSATPPTPWPWAAPSRSSCTPRPTCCASPATTPEDFFVHFELPAHKENAVRLGSLTVGDVVFTIKSWHEDDHDVPDDFKLHVRVVIERMPMQMWSLEGAAEVIGDKCIVDRLDSRTHERGHTRSFACWVWVWDVAHIPTKRIIWRAARGAGRVEAMLGFSPSSRQVAPPPGVKRRELLVHVDRVEDWTPPSPRSSRSRQSGLPSSGSDGDAPFPAIYPGTWARNVEDGQGRRNPPTVASTGCQGMQLGGGRRDHDDRDGERSGRRSWRDALLGRGHGARDAVHNSKKAASSSSRHRSRTPTSRRRHGKGHASHDSGIRATPPHPLRRRLPSPPPPPPPPPRMPPAPLPASPRMAAPEQDPVAEFFSTATDVLASPARADRMQLQLEASIGDTLAAPLSFEAGPVSGQGSTPRSPPDGPAACMQPDLVSAACRAPRPGVATTMQLGAVVQQVQELHLGAAPPASRRLFNEPAPPIIAKTPAPPRRSAAPPKSRAASVPVRQSARQAANPSPVPVAQRATLRLGQGLGVLGPKERMTAQAAEALVRRFDEPLSEEDITGIAKITRLNVEALRALASLSGPDGASGAAV